MTGASKHSFLVLQWVFLQLLEVLQCEMSIYIDHLAVIIYLWWSAEHPMGDHRQYQIVQTWVDYTMNGVTGTKEKTTLQFLLKRQGYWCYILMS